MNKVWKILLLAAFAALPYGSVTGAEGGVFQTETVAAEPARPATVAVYEGSIYITVSEDTTIKVYTILGNLVLEKKIPSGTTQIQLKARGIYLINVGDSIKRVAL